MATTPNSAKKVKTKKDAQHYVWQEYLRAWQIKDTFSCLRKNSIFQPNTKNIAHERHFYKLEELNADEVAIVRRLFINNAPGKKSTAAQAWLDALQKVFVVTNALEKAGYTEAQIAQIIRDDSIINTEENLHNTIENAAGPHLKMLQEENSSFLQDVSSKIDFCHYLSNQYFRTKRSQERFVAAWSNFPGLPSTINSEKCWKIVRHILAERVTYSMIGSPHANIIFLRNPTSTYFLTGDQPVINTFAVGKRVEDEIPATEFYYPLTPTLAMLFTVSEESSRFKKKELTLEEVKYFNDAIADQSHEQLYAATRACLEPYLSA